jgi:starvation-inducible DNA-binding protein
LRSIGHIARLQRIEDNDDQYVSAGAMLTELHRDNLKLVEALREAKELVDAAGDNATSGMLDDWTDHAEERAWFLFETGRDGGATH